MTETYTTKAWDISDCHYRDGAFHVTFHDGTSGSILASQFPELSGVAPATLATVSASPWHIDIESIDWGAPEAGLYEMVNGKSAREAIENALT